MLLHNIVVVLAGATMFAGAQLGLFELFLVGRLVSGVARSFGWFSAIYLAEVSPARYRGAVSMFVGVGCCDLSKPRTYI